MCKLAITASFPLGNRLSPSRAVPARRIPMPLVRPSQGLLALALLSLGACTDRSPTASTGPEPARLLEVTCEADVRAATLSCQLPPLAAGESLGDRIIGGKDVYVKLASSNLAYNATTEIFTADVTVQNLSSVAIGTTDGASADSIRVFFHEGPDRTSGTGQVSVRNPSGTRTFTATGQPYFEYVEILRPNDISAAKTWEFDVDNTVGTFSFSVFVSAPMVDESPTVALLSALWTGAVSTLWSVAGNWSDGTQAPTASSVVTVPADSLLDSSNMPVLDANATVAGLRVGYGSTLGLGYYTLESTGSVDATGAIGNGTLLLSGSATRLSGTVPALRITGSTELQGATKATGPVSVTGSLDLNGRALNIAVP